MQSWHTLTTRPACSSPVATAATNFAASRQESAASSFEQYDALKLDGFGRAPLEHLLVVQALVPTLLCAKCEYRRPDLAFPGTWTCETKEAPRAKGPPSLCHFCNDAGRKVARGHPNASNAPPALPPAVQLAVEQSFPAAQEDAEAEATLIQVLIARRTVGRQGGASSDQHDLMRRALLLCRGDREAALGADESAGTTRKKGSAAIAIVKRAGHVCSLLVYEPDLVDVYSSLVRERTLVRLSALHRTLEDAILAYFDYKTGVQLTCGHCSHQSLHQRRGVFRQLPPVLWLGMDRARESHAKRP